LARPNGTEDCPVATQSLDESLPHLFHEVIEHFYAFIFALHLLVFMM
jgi:hypothetical protein